jgi:hypothetical protein
MNPQFFHTNPKLDKFSSCYFYQHYFRRKGYPETIDKENCAIAIVKCFPGLGLKEAKNGVPKHVSIKY